MLLKQRFKKKIKKLKDQLQEKNQELKQMKNYLNKKLGALGPCEPEKPYESKIQSKTSTEEKKVSFEVNQEIRNVPEAAELLEDLN